MEEATLRPLTRTAPSICHQSDGAVTWSGHWRPPHEPQRRTVGQPDDRAHHVPVTQVEIAVPWVVGFQVRGKAGRVEPGVVPIEQRAADAAVLPFWPDGDEGQIVVR